MILIMGANGSQGRRYKAILNQLNKQFLCFDSADYKHKGCAVCNNHYDIQNQFFHYLIKTEAKISGVIICTPTSEHLDCIKLCLRNGLKVPILCEKPISKDIVQLKDVLKECEISDVKVGMVYQYYHLVKSKAKEESHYDYFNHGKDGLIWDCLQIIGNARSTVCLKEESPIWDCKINGEALHIEDMDGAYFDEIALWLNGHSMSHSKIIDIHQKVEDYDRNYQIGKR